MLQLKAKLGLCDSAQQELAEKLAEREDQIQHLETKIADLENQVRNCVWHALWSALFVQTKMMCHDLTTYAEAVSLASVCAFEGPLMLNTAI